VCGDTGWLHVGTWKQRHDTKGGLGEGLGSHTKLSRDPIPSGVLPGCNHHCSGLAGPRPRRCERHGEPGPPHMPGGEECRSPAYLVPNGLPGALVATLERHHLCNSLQVAGNVRLIQSINIIIGLLDEACYIYFSTVFWSVRTTTELLFVSVGCGVGLWEGIGEALAHLPCSRLPPTPASVLSPLCPCRWPPNTKTLLGVRWGYGGPEMRFKGATPWGTLTPCPLSTSWGPTRTLQPALMGITPRTEP
jgi:hypothetical protein